MYYCVISYKSFFFYKLIFTTHFKKSPFPCRICICVHYDTINNFLYCRKHCYLKKLNRRDASWETVPNAYAELLERPRTCSATCCMCPHENKREHQEES